MIVDIAIVENDLNDTSNLKKEVENYFEMIDSIDFKIHTFSNPLTFLDMEKKEYDIIFLDILMPKMNGMDLAHEIRKRNDKSILIFVTNLTSYAISGYEVGVLDYFVKPVNRQHFLKTMDKAMRELRNNEKKFITLKNKTTVKIVSIKDILYFEADSHLITYNFVNDESFSVWGSVKGELDKFDNNVFIRINSSQVVNAHHITSFDNNKIKLGNEVLFFSRSFKKDAYQRIMDYFGSAI